MLRATYRRRTARVESLEPRHMLAGDTFLVNFQSDEATTPTRYVRDTGDLFGDRSNGLFYGWSTDHTDQARERSIEADQRFDTLVHFELGQRWELQVPNGSYEVTVAVGDPSNDDGLHTINVEGVNLLSAAPDGATPIVVTGTVMVSDGRLTIDQGAAANKATRINYAHIVGLAPPGNAAPVTPTITEPTVDGQIVNPTDVHMEAVGFFETDGDTHRSSDWEIWTTGRIPRPVWKTLGIEGVERLHTHLGDGVFMNNLAGASELVENTNYLLKVRFRDSAGAVSDYAERPFRTGAASTIFAMDIQDIGNSPEPTWVNEAGQPIELPVGVELRIESGGAGESLLEIAGVGGAGNAITNPPSLQNHSPLRLVVEANASAVALAATDLTFVGDDQVRTAFLPAINLAPGQRIDLWIDAAGSTYFGQAAQSSPDFTTLARAAVLSVPFVATQPGFVIEEVGTDYRLPVNIAFVPNPGPDADDPLYFVTELYGSIQVVTRDGTKHEFATGLLDYNPQGPISGSGEQGLTGIAVQRDSIDPDVYHLYVGMLWDNGAPVGGSTHYPKVERITSVAGGLSMDSRTVLLNMQPETQGQSHQISNISIGPDEKLYVHNGDGFDASTGLDLDQFRGKILRMNLDGSAPADNPFYNAADGVTARDYVYAFGLRNPFGGAWRAADGSLYQVENGPSVDRFAKVTAGGDYGWNGSNASMQINALYNWSPSVAPVNIAFVQPETFGGSQFPAAMQGHAFVTESGPTYAAGAQANGKRITEFSLDASGNLLEGPESLIEYVGDGRASVAALAAGPDGLYFSDLYEDTGASGPTAVGSRIYRVRYINPIAGDYDVDGDVDQDDYAVWQASFGSDLLLASDGNGNGVVDIADYTVWRDAYANAQQASALATPTPDSSQPAGPDSLATIGSQASEPVDWAGPVELVSKARPATNEATANASFPRESQTPNTDDLLLYVSLAERSTPTAREDAFAALLESDESEDDRELDGPDRWIGGQATLRTAARMVTEI